MKHSFFALSCWLLAPAAFANLDTNNNGISDFWEKEFTNGTNWKRCDNAATTVV